MFAQALPGTFRQHDPHTALGLNVWHVIGEKALEVDPVTGKVLPHMATSWEVADPAGLSLILRLRPGIKIQNRAPWNGRDFTAQDLAFNLVRTAGLTAASEGLPVAAFQRASLLTNLVQAEAVDPLTVKVTLSAPNSALFNGLTDGRMLMMPREMVDVGFKDPLKMAGTGAFQVVDWVTDQKIRFTRFENYFRAGEPHFDESAAIVIPDPAGTRAAFISGQTQLLGVGSPADADAIVRAKPSTLAYSWVDTSWQHFRPNLAYEPFRDYRVRRALFLSIDYADLGDGYFGPGWAYQAALSPGYPEAWSPERVSTLPGFNAKTKTADRAEASKLLAAAGFPDGSGLDFDLSFPATSEASKENATRFQAQMSGVHPRMAVQLHPYADTAAFAAAQAAGSFKMAAYVITAAPDAVLELTGQFHSNGSRNYGRFSDGALDRLLDRAIGVTTYDDRARLLDEAQQKFISDWLPILTLYAQPARNLLQGDIGGYDTTAGPWYGLSSASKMGRWFYTSG